MKNSYLHPPTFNIGGCFFGVCNIFFNIFEKHPPTLQKQTTNIGLWNHSTVPITVHKLYILMK
jgi:hypothetical protein